jgi:hypothetical protein
MTKIGEFDEQSIIPGISITGKDQKLPSLEGELTEEQKVIRKKLIDSIPYPEESAEIKKEEEIPEDMSEDALDPFKKINITDLGNKIVKAENKEEEVHYNQEELIELVKINAGFFYSCYIQHKPRVDTRIEDEAIKYLISFYKKLLTKINQGI